MMSAANRVSRRISRTRVTFDTFQPREVGWRVRLTGVQQLPPVVGKPERPDERRVLSRLPPFAARRPPRPGTPPVHPEG